MTEKPSPLTTSVQLSASAQAEYFLTFENSDGSFLVYPLDKDVVTVGRTPECDITIADPGISSLHAELRRGSRGNYEVLDQQSSNGTRVNGLATQRAILRGGERIEFGPIECSMECRESELDPEPEPKVTLVKEPDTSELDSTRQKLAAAEQELSQLRELSGTRDGLKRELEQLEGEAGLIKAKYDRTLSELSALTPLLEDAKKSKADLLTTQARLDQARSQLEDLLRDTSEARLMLNELEQQCASKKDQERELDRKILEKQGVLNTMLSDLEGADAGPGKIAAGIPREKAS